MIPNDNTIKALKFGGALALMIIVLGIYTMVGITILVWINSFFDQPEWYTVIGSMFLGFAWLVGGVATAVAYLDD